ncbi:Major Facilitator Superfamily protein [Pseudovibrio axinellae]|uniref:Major Facilitator Superfamily protein n=1 Tax=Pseudovibrio axinellae TaxID=989403 RepID=A0A165XKG7_9HYPH|nr:MFS transporter [Pseudovibrio axinellae]KZL17792.1 Major Facilitator Superfamily protein [Pseudovibrio axinellae]SEP72375.1 Major Facilitator Superfamily protein [Pseudovibrio axinellae]
MTLFSFLQKNLRWVAGGFLLGFGASFGQTFFIAQFSADIRATYNLSHGDFGSIYMLATLASAATIIYLGKVVDYYRPVVVGCTAIVILAGFSFLMSWHNSLIVLGFCLYGLRLFGQGMLPHTSLTAMSRWFHSSRGKALSLASFGNMAGEALLPLAAVSLMAIFSWRDLWLVSAGILLAIMLPLAYLTLRKDRTPENPLTSPTSTRPAVSWTRKQVMADWRFWVVMAAVLAVPFLVTGMMFHQVHFMEAKGWGRAVLPSYLPLYAAAGAVFSILAGMLIDRFSAVALLPFSVVPLGISVLVFAFADEVYFVPVGLSILAITVGSWGAIASAVLAELYGTAHLGAIRSIYSALMVFASALAPGLMGVLVDYGVELDTQFAVSSLYCFGLGVILLAVKPHLQLTRLPA